MRISTPDFDTVPLDLARAAAALLVAAAMSVAVAGLGGCAQGGEPATFAVPRAAAARIRMTCPPGPSVDPSLDSMVTDCPQPLGQPPNRGAPAR